MDPSVTDKAADGLTADGHLTLERTDAVAGYENARLDVAHHRRTIRIGVCAELQRRHLDECVGAALFIRHESVGIRIARPLIGDPVDRFLHERAFRGREPPPQPHDAPFGIRNYLQVAPTVRGVRELACLAPAVQRIVPDLRGAEPDRVVCPRRVLVRCAELGEPTQLVVRDESAPEHLVDGRQELQRLRDPDVVARCPLRVAEAVAEPVDRVAGAVEDERLAAVELDDEIEELRQSGVHPLVSGDDAFVDALGAEKIHLHDTNIHSGSDRFR